MLTIKQCAEKSCVSEALVRQWVAEGRLPHYRLGAKGKRGKLMVDESDLDALLASFKVSGPASVPAPKPRRPAVMPRHLRLPT